MQNTDGSLIIGVDLTLTKAEKQLKKFESKVEETEKKINDLTAKRDQAKQDGVFQAGVLDEEKSKLEEIKSRLRETKAIAANKTFDSDTRQGAKNIIPDIQSQLAEQQERVRALQAEWNATQKAVEKYDNQLLNANIELDKNKAKAGELADAINKSNKPAERFKQHLQEAGDNVDKLGERIKKLVTRVMVFSMFTLALRSMRTWMLNVIKTNDQATQAIAKLKGALLTMVQPLVNIIIPAFITFVQVLTKVVSTIATLISALFGTTAEESAKAAKNLQSEQDALNGVGKAAKNAGKQLASFDEINQLQDTSEAGGASSTEIAPSFEIEFPEIEQADKFINAIKLIAAALLALKFSNGFLDGITKFAGFAIAIQGVSIALQGLKDAWENGVDWDNVSRIIGGVALAATGLYIALGPVAAGIALIVGGIAMLVTGFHDAMENGWNLENMFLSIAGILASGAGIAILTGSWIPLLVAGIAAALLALVVAFGDGEKLIEDLKLVFEGLIDFVTGVFTGDMDKAIGGIGKIFDGLRGIVENIFGSIENMIDSFFDWLDEKTGGQFTLTINWIRDTLKSFVAWWADLFDGLLSGLQQMFQGLVEFIGGAFSGDWDMAFNGLVEIGKGAVNLLITALESFVNFFINGVNALIRALNTISFTVPDWVPGFGGQTFGINIQPIPKFTIPRLAQGAVIPPNREFLAVLGDQKSGTNIETPLSTMVQAFKQAALEVGMGGSGKNITVILQLDRRELGRAVYTLNNEETQRVGVRLAGVST